jgi:hypothetical protein
MLRIDRFAGNEEHRYLLKKLDLVKERPISEGATATF